MNSVIVDLQRKNESLQLQLEAATSLHKLDDDDVLKYVSLVVHLINCLDRPIVIIV